MLRSDPTSRSQREIGYFIARPIPNKHPLFVLRLKLIDVAACFVLPVLLVVVLQPIGGKHVYVPLIGYINSSMFWCLAMAGTFLCFIVGNSRYPEGDLWRVFKRWGLWLWTHDRWSAQVRCEDKLWTPSNLRELK